MAQARNSMPLPEWETDAISVSVEKFVRGSDNVSEIEIADALKLDNAVALAILNKLRKRGVVGPPGWDGRSPVLRRGDISILTRQRTEELLSALKGDRYNFRSDRDHVIVLDSQRGSEITFFELRDLELFCRCHHTRDQTDGDLETKGSKQPDEAETILLLQSRISELEHTIADLRRKGRRVVADRDRWEARARQLDTENSQLKITHEDKKFRALKVAITRICHPDNYSSSGRLEALVRTEIFKELWAELEKIERP
jgi:hypothetical protein